MSCSRKVPLKGVLPDRLPSCEPPNKGTRKPFRAASVFKCDNEEEGNKKCDINADLDDNDEECIKRLIKQKREDTFLQRILCRQDKTNQRINRDNLFRRVMMEEGEKRFQECLCQEEDRRRELDLKFQYEEDYAKELIEQRDCKIKEAAFMKQLLNCTPEVRELEELLRKAYFAKSNYAQRIEAEASKLQDRVSKMEDFEYLSQKKAEHTREEYERKVADMKKQRELYEALTRQMTEKNKAKEQQQALDEEERKARVDEIVSEIKNEQLQDYLEKANKLKIYRNDMLNFIKSREETKKRLKERDIEEDKRIQGYLEKKAEDERAFLKKKSEGSASKAQMVEKVISKIMAEQFKNEELEELRRELQLEEQAEEIRRKEQEQKEKKERQMLELKQASEEAQRIRAETLAAEKKEDQNYRKQLSEKFEQDMLEEAKAFKYKKWRERDHRLQLERMITERRYAEAMRKEKDQHLYDCIEKETQQRKDMIEKVKLDMIREHGPGLLGFLPPGVVKREDLQKLGEPFISYYSEYNDIYEPHPTTIGAEECEKEIFRNMKLPRNVRY